MSQFVSKEGQQNQSDVAMHKDAAVFNVCTHLALLRHSAAADRAGSHGHISGMADIRGVPHEVFSELISINELKQSIFEPAPKAR